MLQPLFSGQAPKETNEQASLCAQLIRLVCGCVGVGVDVGVWVFVWVCMCEIVCSFLPSRSTVVVLKQRAH